MEIIESDNAAYELHDNYVVVRFFEGGQIGIDEAVFIKTLLSEKFQQPFGWISDRINSYSVDPTLVKDMLEDLSNFKCVSWVCYGSSIKSKISTLYDFIPEGIETKVLHSIPEAIEWTEHIVESSRA